jgi:hypothetical protein
MQRLVKSVGSEKDNPIRMDREMHDASQHMVS